MKYCYVFFSVICQNYLKRVSAFCSLSFLSPNQLIEDALFLSENRSLQLTFTIKFRDYPPSENLVINLQKSSLCITMLGSSPNHMEEASTMNGGKLSCIKLASVHGPIELSGFTNGSYNILAFLVAKHDVSSVTDFTNQNDANEIQHKLLQASLNALSKAEIFVDIIVPESANNSLYHNSIFEPIFANSSKYFSVIVTPKYDYVHKKITEFAYIFSDYINQNQYDPIKNMEPHLMPHSNLYNRMEHNSNINNKQFDNKKKNQTIKKLLLYFKDLDRHAANNRLVAWACHSHELPISIEVITSQNDNNNDHNQSYNMNYNLLTELHICNIPVHQYSQLNLYESIQTLNYINKDISNLLSPIHPTHLKVNQPHPLKLLETTFYTLSPSLCQLLKSFQSLIVLNTYGDPQTLLMLYYARACGESLAILVDLPNIQISVDWIGLFDGLIAPSKYVAFHPLIINHQLPVAVIYPPLSTSFLTTTSKHCYVDNWYSQQQQQQQQQVTPFTILFVGRLETEKCPGILVRALHLFQSLIATVQQQQQEQYSNSNRDLNSIDNYNHSSHPFRVMFVGDGPLLTGLLTLANLFHIEDRIIFRGSLSLDEVMNEMKKADVLVNPIASGETFGYVTVEAAAIGLPVIAFDRGAVKEVIGEGILIPLLSAKHLAEAIFKVYVSKKEKQPLFSSESLCFQSNLVKSRLTPDAHSKALWRTIEEFTTYFYNNSENTLRETTINKFD